MTSLDTGRVGPSATIGFTVDCGQEGRSAGFDTKGDYLLRVSVKFDPKAFDDPQRDDYFAGSTHRQGDGGRHPKAPAPINIDTWFEGGGNQADRSAFRADDTQDIADKLASNIKDLEASGKLPPGQVKVETDGGPRGNCHARITLQGVSHADIGAHSYGKFSVFIMTQGMDGDFSVTGAEDPKPDPQPGAGPADTGGWSAPSAPLGSIPLKPRVPIEYDPYVDRPFRRSKGRAPDFRPADPENGKRLIEDRIKRRGRLPVATQNKILAAGSADRVAGSFTVVASVDSVARRRDVQLMTPDEELADPVSVSSFGSCGDLLAGVREALARAQVVSVWRGQALEVLAGGRLATSFAVTSLDGSWLHLAIDFVRQTAPRWLPSIMPESGPHVNSHPGNPMTWRDDMGLRRSTISEPESSRQQALTSLGHPYTKPYVDIRDVNINHS